MRFADFLADMGISQDRAAAELGITQGRVSQLALGATPSWRLLARIKEWSGDKVTETDWLPAKTAAPVSAGATQ